MKRRAKTAAEEDVVADHGRWRRRYCYLQPAGVAAGIKRQMRRRERREDRVLTDDEAWRAALDIDWDDEE